MDPWQQNADLIIAALLAASALATFFARDLIDDFDAPDEGHAWRDDPTVVAMLSGMSL